MLIIGCDFHTRYRQIAMMDEDPGELVERRLDHENGEAHTFYPSLVKPVRVEIEATGPMHWFERLLTELGHQLWIADSGTIRARSFALAQRVGVVDCVRMTIHNEVPSPQIYFYEFQYFSSHEIPLDSPYNSIVTSLAGSDERFEYSSRNGPLRCRKSVELPKNSAVHGSISKRRTLSLIDATDTSGSVTPLESMAVVTI